jgi:hypothetical protein
MIRANRAVFLVVAALMFAACSNSDEPSSAEPTTAITEAPATEQPTSAVTSIVVKPGTTPGVEGARDDVEVRTCQLGENGWEIEGSVTNPTESPADYRIYTSFRDESTATVGLLQVDANGVRPGRSEDWSGVLDLSVPDLECILRVERLPTPDP